MENDYISRESVQSKIVAAYFDETPFPTKIRDLLDDVAAIPAADVRPVVRGEWLPIIEGNELGEAIQTGCYCSECGEALQHEPNFCPNCGAVMRPEGGAGNV